MKHYVLFIALFAGIHISKAQNIPLATILNKAFQNGMKDTVLYYQPSWDISLLDTIHSAGERYTISIYKTARELQNILDQKKQVTALGVEPLAFVGDTLRLTLNIRKLDVRYYDPQKKFLADASGSMDIECIYNKVSRKWEYLKTLESRDF